MTETWLSEAEIRKAVAERDYCKAELEKVNNILAPAVGLVGGVTPTPILAGIVVRALKSKA